MRTNYGIFTAILFSMILISCGKDDDDSVIVNTGSFDFNQVNYDLSKGGISQVQDGLNLYYLILYSEGLDYNQSEECFVGEGEIISFVFFTPLATLNLSGSYVYRNENSFEPYIANVMSAGLNVTSSACQQSFDTIETYPGIDGSLDLNYIEDENYISEIDFAFTDSLGNTISGNYIGTLEIFD